MDVTEKVLDVMRAEGRPLNAGKIAELSGLEWNVNFAIEPGYS